MTVEFVDDLPPGPSTKRPHIELRRLAAELRANPGKWAVIHAGISSNSAQVRASQIRHGRTASFGPGFDAAYREVDGEHRTYARYVGEPS